MKEQYYNKIFYFNVLYNNNIPYFNSTVVCFREYKDGGFFNKGGSGFFIFLLQTSRQNVDPVVGGGGGGEGRGASKKWNVPSKVDWRSMKSGLNYK